MDGPGKYDDLCTKVREETKATGVILVVMDGNRGYGFSVQAPLVIVLGLPQILRDLAGKIEEDIAKGRISDS